MQFRGLVAGRRIQLSYHCLAGTTCSTTLQPHHLLTGGPAAVAAATAAGRAATAAGRAATAATV